MFTFRRVVGAALEDFGLRRPVVPPPEAAETGETGEGPDSNAVVVDAAQARARRRARRAERRAAAPLPLWSAQPTKTSTGLSKAAVAGTGTAPPAPAAVDPTALVGDRPAQVIWRGRARRTEELQRFVDHLEATGPPSRN